MSFASAVTDTFATVIPGTHSIGTLIIGVVAGLVIVGIVVQLVGRLGGGRLSRGDDPNERKPTGESFTFGGK